MAFTKGTASFTNGSKTVTSVSLTSGQLAYFGSGTAVFVQSEGQLIEATGLPKDGNGDVIPNQFLLHDDWTGPTGSYGFVAFDTIEGLRDAVQSARGFSEQLQAALSSFSVAPVGDSNAKRTTDGRVKASNATDTDDSIVLGQADSRYFRKNVVASASYFIFDVDGYYKDEQNFPRFYLGGNQIGFSHIFRASASNQSFAFRDVNNNEIGNISDDGINVGSQTQGKLVSAKLRHYGDSFNDQGRVYSTLDFNVSNNVYGNGTHAYIRAIHTRAGTGHTNSDAGLIFGTSAATNDAIAVERMRINAVNGRVGVGLNNPSSQLEVNGDVTANAFIESSDERLKSNQYEIRENTSILDVWSSLRAKFFQWNRSIEEKGVEHARFHAGWMAQEIEQALVESGLGIDAYGLICKEPVYEEQETGEVEEYQVKVTETVKESETEIQIIDGTPTQIATTKEKQVECCDMVQVVDEAGNGLTEKVKVPIFDENGKPVLNEEGSPTYDIREEPITYPVARMETKTRPVTEKVIVDYKYRLRYTQCLILETAYLRRELERLKAA